MKTALAALAVLIACLLAMNCIAQSMSGFQNLGGEYGRSVIGTLKANDTKQPAAGNNSSNESNSLWNWGNAPKGSLVQNGKLVADPFNTWKSLNYTDGWIGQVEVDTFTGRPIYAYKIPNTRETKYFYLDPYTGDPIYVERNNALATANGVSRESFALPPIFR